jgi:uncharacterized protein (DUF983 family)
MMLQRKCPKCGQLVEYIAEQVGSQHKCEKCAEQFELVANDFRVAMRIVWAGVVAFGLLLGYVAVQVAIKIATGQVPIQRK